ncbi:SOS response-associated peptidase [Patescibacteria group bacterium]
MCGRIVLTESPEEFTKRYQLAREINFEKNYNITPGQKHPIVHRDNNDKNVADSMLWGLVPHWSKEPKTQYSTINARFETIESSPAFRQPYRSKRCLVPVTGFYEWQQRNGAKTPYYFHDKLDRLMSIAGLYDIWENEQGHKLESFTLVTTGANIIMKPVHDRMPAILDKADEELWLDLETPDDVIKKILSPHKTKNLETHAISDAVNNPRNNSADLIKPIKY